MLCGYASSAFHMGFIPGDKASSHGVCFPCFIEVLGLGREKAGYMGVVFVVFLFITNLLSAFWAIH